MITNTNKKIAVIGLKGLPAFGGAAAVGENIIENLKDKFDFTVYSVSSHTNFVTGNYDGVDHIVFKKTPVGKFNTLIYYLRSALHALFRGNYDLIHLHHSDAAFLIPLLKLKYKVVVTTHGAHNLDQVDEWKGFKWFFEWQIPILKKAEKVTCVSKVEKKWLWDSYEVDAIYIPNGIKITKSLQSLNKTKDYIFFSAGRIIKSKGLDNLLNALISLNYKGKLYVAGNLDQNESYKQIILKLAKKLDVSFIGLIFDKKNLLSYIAHSKIFVYPSYAEAMSMMLLEAASVGAKIICSDIPENKDVFNDDEVLYFKTGDIDDLAEKIQYSFDNYPVMIEKSERAYNNMKINHDWKNISEGYLKIFNQFNHLQ